MEMAQVYRETVGNAGLETWETFGIESFEKEWDPVGSGGFGCVYKARHKDWGLDLAIKILSDGVRSPCEEAYYMKIASCEFAVRVYGIYKGCQPSGGISMQRGIVMDFMKHGSVQSLLNHLSGPPPWPLAFRLADQVAIGMTFLHSKEIMHHDLKPYNVLLDKDLNAKVADFGLARVSTSALNSNKETTEVGGSYKYMPPEAFEASYEPARAFDRYSYGILLWSIVTGKEPYQKACYNLVALRIPKGDRPPCEDIDQRKTDGLKEIVKLMKRCWDGDPSSRPTFRECRTVTETVFSKHEKGISDAVHQVLKTLESPNNNHHSETSEACSSSFDSPELSKSHDTVDTRYSNIERPSIQNSVNVSTKRMTDLDKAKFVDDNRAHLIQVVSAVMAIVDELGNMVHAETYSGIRAKDTNREKMRELYETALHSGGEKVKAAFYDALEKHHPQIVERPGGYV